MIDETLIHTCINSAGNDGGPEVFAVPSSELYGGANRLESSFYGSQGYRAAKALEKSGFQLERVGDLARVLWFGPFARTYVSDVSCGVAFFSSSEMLEARPNPKNFISRSLTKNLERLIVRQSTILISCSGTIGNVVLCTTDLDGLAVSQHAIRVIPNDASSLGTLYGFLESEAGQFLIRRNKSGSVVESIYGEDVAALRVPRLPKALRQELARLISEASALRVDSNKLLAVAEAAVLDSVRTPKSARKWPRYDLECFDCPSSMVRGGTPAGTQYHRLDSNFYNPTHASVVSDICATASHLQIRQIAGDTVLIGKTFVEGVHKVEGDVGVPYYTGKELFAGRPVPETFIFSQNRKILDRLTCKRGTVLVTCAGTVGRVIYVYENFEGAAVTHDAIRVLPGTEVHPGYVYAFLASALGQIQLQRCAYGSVIPRLYRTHVEQLLVTPPSDEGESIGSKVDDAFSKRAKAFKLENQSIALLMEAITTGKTASEALWGKEY